MNIKSSRKRLLSFLKKSPFRPQQLFYFFKISSDCRMHRMEEQKDSTINKFSTLFCLCHFTFCVCVYILKCPISYMYQKLIFLPHPLFCHYFLHVKLYVNKFVRFLLLFQRAYTYLCKNKSLPTFLFFLLLYLWCYY